MRAVVTRHLSGFHATELFDVAADIEAYPDFLFWCEHTRITRREDATHWVVDNLFGIGPLKARFATRATLDPPHALEVASDEPPFEHFHLTWRFEETEGGCSVTLGLEQRFRNRLFEAAARPFMREAEEMLIRAFERRAREVRRAKRTP